MRGRDGQLPTVGKLSLIAFQIFIRDHWKDNDVLLSVCAKSSENQQRRLNFAQEGHHALLSAVPLLETRAPVAG